MDKVSENQELGRVTLGVPGVVSAQVPVRRSHFGWFKNRFTRQLVANPLLVASARARVHVPVDDEGTIEFYLAITNMGAAPLLVETITSSRAAANGNDLAILGPVSRSPEKTLNPGKAGEVGVRFPIGAPAIRTMLRCVQCADNKFSSPRLELLVTGDIAGNVEGKPFQLRFTVASYSPELHIYCPSIKDM